MKIIYLFCFLLSIQAFAQCPDSDKMLYAVKEMISDSSIFFAVNNDYSGSKHHISSIPNYANGAMTSAGNYIKQRSGAAFEKKCRVKYMYVNYPEGTDEDREGTALYQISDYDVTYTVAYTWQHGEYNYDFEVVLDNDHNVISEDVLPSVANDPDLDKLIDVCKALKTAKAQKQYKGVIGGIGIAYDSGVDAFCWQIEEHPGTIPETGQYPVRDYYINATTGKLVNVKETSMYFFQSEEPVKPKAKATKKRKKAKH